ncbi:hypothetical protein U8C40_28910 (plasmid) [Sinorhizobium medicae]|nr:hypothetical protein U8C40_28910 [Sinorhizobium medicae]
MKAFRDDGDFPECHEMPGSLLEQFQALFRNPGYFRKFMRLGFSASKLLG